MTRKSFFGWVGFSLVTSITLVGFATPNAAFAARSKRDKVPKALTVSGPIDISASDEYDFASERYEFHGWIQYQLDQAVFKLDPRKSRGSNIVYTLVSGTIRGEENSWRQFDEYDADGNHIYGEWHKWTGELPPQALSPGTAELVLNKRSGDAELVLNLPAVPGIVEGTGGTSQYQGAAAGVRSVGTLKIKKGRGQGTLELSQHVPNPDPFAGKGVVSSAFGTLTVN